MDIAYWGDGRSEQGLITRIRRAIATQEDLEGYGPERVEVALRFEQYLVDMGLIDYEAMVIRTLSLVRKSAGVRDLIAARYPWIVVDEYQDLGNVLHQLILTLHYEAGIEICAVGDPDQSVMGFTGADPRYLNELADDHRFADVNLDINYRCGSAIIAAADAALGQERGHLADPERDEPGVVEPIRVTGDLDEHAGVVIDRIRDLTARGVPADQIAILYPARGRLLSCLVESLTTESVLFIHERDDRLPTGPLAEFLRGCAGRRLAGPRPCGATGTSPNVSVPTLSDLLSSYQRLRSEAGLPPVPTLATISNLQKVIDKRPAEGSAGDEPVVDMVNELDGILGLDALSEVRGEDAGSVAALSAAYDRYNLTLEAFAGVDASTGKVVLTTYHSAKGREFRFVILPGLVEGIMPRWAWVRGEGYVAPPPPELAQSRRMFYVGLTRASDAAVLIYGPGWRNDGGYWTELGPSRFAVDVVEAIHG